MNFYTLDPFLFVGHFAGHSIAGSPLLPCPSLDITELSLELGYPAPEGLPRLGQT
jgi:hypothetical protein